jgi:hypothetical protein
MRLIRGRRASRLLLMVALLPLPLAAADQAADIAERAVRLDQVIQALKDEVVEFGTEAQSIEDTVMIPEHQRVSVYLRVAVAGLLLQQVSIAIDERDADIYDYDDRDSRALLSDTALQRVLRTTAGPGPHRIRVNYRGRYADDAPDAAPLTGSYEAIFDKDHKESELEITVSRASRFGGELRVDMKQWRRQR